MRVDVDRVIVIGREGADLTIRDTELSRRHAVLRPFDGGVEVEDLGSTNGTYVDGQRIRGAVRITGAARLRMGSSEIDLQPETAAAPVAAAPAPPAGDVEPITPAADRPQPEGGRSLRKVGAVLMVLAGVVTVAVLATAFATSSSSGTKLASRPGIRLPPPALVPFVTHAGSGETVVIRGSSYSIIAPSSGTGGAFTLIKIDLHHGSEPPPHTHHRESEAFYLLRGAMTFQAGGAMFHARPGDFVYLPHNVEHAYTVTSGVAQVLLLAVPGGLDRFFVALAHQPALARQLGQRFGIQPLLPGGGGAPPGSAGGASPGRAPAPGSIPFITPAGKGVTVKIRGSTYTILADSVATGGAFGFLDIVLHHGSEPPAAHPPSRVGGLLPALRHDELQRRRDTVPGAGGRPCLPPARPPARLRGHERHSPRAPARSAGRPRAVLQGAQPEPEARAAAGHAVRDPARRCVSDASPDPGPGRMTTRGRLAA